MSYKDRPRGKGWLMPLLLGWVSLLSMAIVAAWLAFESVDTIVQNYARDAATAVAPKGPGNSPEPTR
jgi:hypothetical protein